MANLNKGEKQLDWACRIFIVADLFIVLAGYIFYFQSKWQLTSPLIPKDTVIHILYDGVDATLKVSMIAGLIFLPGLVLYTFSLKKLSLLLFITVPIFYLLFPYIHF
jgi:hypothetical protein